MPFWKQSDDPWDRKPEKRRPMPKEAEKPKKGILERLDGWQENRKSAAKEKEEAKRLPPEPCPWCGKDMEQGYLSSGRGVWWAPGVPNFLAKWVSIEFAEGAFQVDHNGSLSPYKITWFCRDCKKMVFDISDSVPYDYSAEETEKTKEEEPSEE